MGFSRQNWVSSLFNILKSCNLLLLTEKSSFTKAENAFKIAKYYFESQFIQSWLNEMLNKPKLKTYIIFKDEFNFEKYLYVYNENHRHALSRFRLSAHSLEIERGRWHKPVIPEKGRTCKFCLNGQIENEKHSFSDCFLYTDLMQTTNIDLCHLTAKFIYQITNGRNDCLLEIPKPAWALHLCFIILHLFMTLVSLLFSIQVCLLIQ